MLNPDELLRDMRTDKSEFTDFFAICLKCTGPRYLCCMTKIDNDEECKVCKRTFTVFRWNKGGNRGYKKTEICRTCSDLNNACQACQRVFEYVKPVPDPNPDRAALFRVIRFFDEKPEAYWGGYTFAGKLNPNRKVCVFAFPTCVDLVLKRGNCYRRRTRGSDLFLQMERAMSRSGKYREPVCKFLLTGECASGFQCPCKHGTPVPGGFPEQNIKDNYNGVNYPAAMELLNNAGEMQSLDPPEDESSTTLYVCGLHARITEKDLRDKFYAYGEIESIRMELQQGCAFVTYTTHESAEKALVELSDKLVIRGLRLKLFWGEPQLPKPEIDGADQAEPHAAVIENNGCINPAGTLQDQVEQQAVAVESNSRINLTGTLQGHGEQQAAVIESNSYIHQTGTSQDQVPPSTPYLKISAPALQDRP